MAKYMYPAKFTPETDGSFSVLFTDFDFEGSKFGIATGGKNLIDAIEMANDALCLMLYHAEQRGDKLPKPSTLDTVKVGKGEFVQYVSCDTDWYQRYYEKKAVKKTLTIPSYLNAMAKREGINFSAVLQEALKQRLLN